MHTLVVAGAKHAIRPVVLLDQLHLLLTPASSLQILQGVLVHGEQPTCGPILRAHIGHRHPVRHRQRRRPLSIELNKLADTVVLAQELGDREHHVRRRHARGQAALEMDPDNLGQHQAHGLAQHGCLGLDATDAPGDDTDTVHHGGVAVGAHATVRVGDPIPHGYNLCDLLAMHLVHDACARRHHRTIAEALLCPLQKFKSFLIALKLNLHVLRQSVRGAGHVYNHGVIHHEVDPAQWVHALGVAASCFHRVPHCTEVHEHGNSGQILQDNSGRKPVEIRLPSCVLVIQDSLDIALGHGNTVAVADGRLKKQPDADGQRGYPVVCNLLQ
mmetsp:Transcript_19863/g.48249  ORF Transcript_19863/g.48249 Transcript_19863/m.48249 type:complete len:329 (-) Transcript_19863:142-1128(-)